MFCSYTDALQMLVGNLIPLLTVFSKQTECGRYLIWRNAFLVVEFQASAYRGYFELESILLKPTVYLTYWDIMQPSYY